ncbi:MAG: extracellular solute-binding protein [Alphaproteobacteria bacterium]
MRPLHNAFSFIIPANAGIQHRGISRRGRAALDSRLRGNDKSYGYAIFSRYIAAACLLFFSAFAAMAATPEPYLTMYGTAKYAPGFSHFDYVNPAAPKGGTLKLNYTGNFDSLNPYILKGVAAPGVSNFVFQSLMTPSYDEPQSYYPLIARSVAVAPDRSYADFFLNPEARWHDGKPITSADVVFSLNTLKQDGHPVYRVLYKPIEKAVAVSPHQVRFYFSDREHRELPLIAASMPILPKHYYASVAFNRTTLTPPLGSGPYKITGVEAGRSISFSRVKDYWGRSLPTQKGLYNFDEIRFDVYRDDVVALEGIKSGQFDYYEEYIARNWATAYNIEAVKRGELLKLKIPHKIPRGMQGFLFNLRRDKFADRRVREAIGLTLDFEWMNHRLFYDAYTRSSSFFQNTEFMAESIPQGAELKLLEPFRCETPSPRRGEDKAGNDCLPPALFTEPFRVPTTDGTGVARENLIRAQALLNEAGWVMRDGVRVNAKTGEPLIIEFLMTQSTFERVISIMRKNLKRLGIASSFRYVDASQYQKRIDRRDFDIVSIWWNQGQFYPGAEQFAFWHSSQASIEGSQNLGGAKNPAVDRLVERIMNAQSLEELRTSARALDRVLLWENYVIPHWHLSAWRIVHWDKFGKPKIQPAYNTAIDSWWAKEAR